MFRRCSLALACTLALTGCAGLREAHDSRVCWQGPWPAIWPDQCEFATVEFHCPAKLAVAPQVAQGPRDTLVMRIARSAELPIVGELFSQFCPPRCIPILAAPPTPPETLRQDTRTLLVRAGYELATDPDTASAELELRLESVDVRSDRPGFWDIKATTRAAVSFGARLRRRDGETAWSGQFSGEAQIRHAYAALADSERILGSAYCQALQQFADAIAGAEFADSLIRREEGR